MLRYFLILTLCLFSTLAAGWEDHALLTRKVLEGWMRRDVSAAGYLNQSVQVESLQSFLRATKTTLPARMMEIETWARNREPGYQPLPKQLIYDPARPDCAKALDVCFEKALRINLDVPLRSMVYDPSGFYERRRGFNRILDAREMMPSYIAADNLRNRFVSVPDHAYLRLADVIATASIQPDFGFDVYLYENNPSLFGKLYGFGSQPFGAAAIPYSSQGFFHMSSYHESGVLFLLMPPLKNTYPEYRAAMYMALSRFAAETSHPYWAALFMGWGLHYVQDMTQPYHSSLTRGLTYSNILTALVDKIRGNDKAFSDLTNIQANRHILLENVISHIMTSSKQDFDEYKLLLNANLIDSSRDNDIPGCAIQTNYLRNEIVPRIERDASRYMANFHELLPTGYANNPEFNAGLFRDYDGLLLRDMSSSQRLRMSRELAPFLEWYGAYTRNCIRQYGMKA